MKAKTEVWHGEGVMSIAHCSIAEGKREMKKLLKEGKESIRMYVDYYNEDEGEFDKRFYYSLKDGKIVKEDNNFNN